MSGTVGIDIGGTSIKAVRLDGGGSVVESCQCPTPSAADLIDVVAGTAARLGAGLDVGVGCAGLVDFRRGVLVWSPHLQGTNVPLRQALSTRLGVQVVVDNDTNLAALAEHRSGAGIGHDDVLMVTVGTGIGMGVILDGALRRGRAHAGEVGHITADPGGPVCACGRQGCWETKVSGSRLDAEAVALFGRGAGGVDLVNAAGGGHLEAGEILNEMGEWLAWGIEVMALALDPSIVIVGGAAVAVGDVWLNPVRERLAGTEGGGHRPPIDVMAGILGSNAGAIGAAMVVADGGVDTTGTGLRGGGQSNV